MTADVNVQAREGRFETLVQHIPDLIAVLQSDGTIGFLNLSATRILGYDPRDLVGRDVTRTGAGHVIVIRQLQGHREASHRMVPCIQHDRTSAHLGFYPSQRRPDKAAGPDISTYFA